MDMRTLWKTISKVDVGVFNKKVKCLIRPKENLPTPLVTLTIPPALVPGLFAVNRLSVDPMRIEKRNTMVGKLFNNSAGKNQGPILQILQSVIPEKFDDSIPLNALEIASGTGQHVTLFAKSFPNITWQPSELGSSELESIKAYIKDEGLLNVKQPLTIDISKPLMEWPGGLTEGSLNMVICINMIHISPWECTEGLFKAAGALLAPGGILVTYGAYAIHGEIKPESSVVFDASLKGRNPLWGLRDVDTLEKEAQKSGMSFDAMFDMPSNNKTLIFLKN